MGDDRHQRDEPSRRVRGRSSEAPDGAVPFFPEGERARIEERLLYLTRRRFRFREEVARQLASEAMEAYLAAHPHYAASADHALLLMRVLRGKCREHIRRQICRTAQGNAIREVLKGVDVPEAMAAGALDEIASRDTRTLILEALSEMRPRTMEALRSLSHRATRLQVLEVVELLGFEQQTEAPDASTYHSEFRQILARGGVRL
jgi:hypothetical protein